MKSYIKGYNDSRYVFKICCTAENHIKYMTDGLNHLFDDNGILKLYTYDGYILMPDDAKELFDKYDEDDVLEIDEKGIVYEVYRVCSDDNALVVTLMCNSNCIMCPCSETSRKNSGLCSFDELDEKLKYIPPYAPYITVTGGEPTLLREDFFRLMETLKYRFEQTDFLLLTNGRAFGDYNFTKKFAECVPERIKLGIPIYGYSSETHDMITQAKESFKQTVIGIHNLLHFNMIVELRVVLTKLNIEYIEKIADYVISHFPGIFCINFMGLEMLGNAAKNREAVWIDYKEAFVKIEKSVRKLIGYGINVSLYNFPLCTVDKKYWSICAKSISDYKILFNEKCDRCDIKSICGGIFESTQRVTNFEPHPIKEVNKLAELF